VNRVGRETRFSENCFICITNISSLFLVVPLRAPSKADQHKSSLTRLPFRQLLCFSTDGQQPVLVCAPYLVKFVIILNLLFSHVIYILTKGKKNKTKTKNNCSHVDEKRVSD
jgi:hypothetical protein